MKRSRAMAFVVVLSGEAYDRLKYRALLQNTTVEKLAAVVLEEFANFNLPEPERSNTVKDWKVE